MPQNHVQTTIFFLKCHVPSQDNGHCYIIIHLCVCYILMLCFCCVVVLLYLMCFPQFQFVTRICFFLNQLMNFEQRYTTVAFINGNTSIFNFAFHYFV